MLLEIPTEPPRFGRIVAECCSITLIRQWLLLFVLLGWIRHTGSIGRNESLFEGSPMRIGSFSLPFDGPYRRKSWLSSIKILFTPKLDALDTVGRAGEVFPLQAFTNFLKCSRAWVGVARLNCQKFPHKITRATNRRCSSSAFGD